jgi:hypothetical protein
MASIVDLDYVEAGGIATRIFLMGMNRARPVAGCKGVVFCRAA